MRTREAGLSDKQSKMRTFIQKFLDEHGYPPTVRDIQHACGISSTSVVDYNLNILEERGVIKRNPDISRGIEMVGTGGKRTVRIPMLSSIAAGEPLSVPDAGAASRSHDTYDIPQELVAGKANVYALKVKGTSMIDALIDDGDIVIMQQTSSADNGDMVAARLKLDNSFTLKRFYKEPTRIRLQPANSQMQPIYVRPEDMEIQGRVLGVIRKL